MEDEEANKGEGTVVDFVVKTASVSEKLPRPETRQTTASISNDVLSSNGTFRENEEILLVPSVEPSASGLISRASSASPRILKPARAALSRPQASAPYLVGGGGAGEGRADRHMA